MLGWLNHPLAKWGGRPPPMGWLATMFGLFFFFLDFLATPYGLASYPVWHFLLFFGFFFLKKKCDGGILGINRPNELNCHNLKV
jgi:hypothetical protein